MFCYFETKCIWQTFKALNLDFSLFLLTLLCTAPLSPYSGAPYDANDDDDDE